MSLSKALIIYLALLTLYVPPSYALPMNMHKIITFEASSLYGVPSELRVYLGNLENCPSNFKDSLCDGVYDEDADRDPRINLGNPFSWISMFNWGTHFWDPEEGPYGGLLRYVGDVPVNLDSENAYQRAKDLYKEAVSIYNSDTSSAYYLLGRVIHLIEDMATPAHTHLDPHIADSTIYGDDSFEEYFDLNYRDDQDGIANFRRDFPITGLLPMDYKMFPNEGYSGEPPLYSIFYSMAKISKSFDSDDADGVIDNGGRRGRSIIPSRDVSELRYVLAGITDSFEKKLLLDYGLSLKRNKFILSNSVLEGLSNTDKPFDFIRLEFTHGSEIYPIKDFIKTDIDDKNVLDIANTLILSSIKHTAAVYKLFWEDTHPTFIENVPLMILNNGFYRYNVIRPEPVDIKIYLDPEKWRGVDVEVYAWIDSIFQGDRIRLYYSKDKWYPFDKNNDIRPAISTLSLYYIEGILWRIVEDSSLLPEGAIFNLNLCIDRHIDAILTPSEAICNSISVKIL